LLLCDEGLGDLVVEKLALKTPEADLSEWHWVVNAKNNPQYEVNIAMVGKYTELTDSYKSLSEALIHAGIHTKTRINILYVDAEDLEKGNKDVLSQADAILVPGGFGSRGAEGKVIATQY